MGPLVCSSSCLMTRPAVKANGTMMGQTVGTDIGQESAAVTSQKHGDSFCMMKMDCLCSGVKVAALTLQVEESNVQEAIRGYNGSIQNDYP